MKTREIEVIRIENEDTELVSEPFAINKGELPDFGVTTKVVYDFFGNYQNENDEANYKKVIDALCHHHSIEMFGYHFYFKSIILYEH